LLEVVLESLGLSDAEGVPERVEPSFTSPVRISEEMRTLRALVVDDNEANLVVARLMLERCGCQVETVNGGEQALQRLQEVGFDFVLMDCSMPGIDGYETTRRIRALELPEERQPFIAGVTAFVLPGEKERCLSSGMDSYLPKPVSLQSMHDLVVRTLKRA
jgi:CheY-like chemotaxis protein